MSCCELFLETSNSGDPRKVTASKATLISYGKLQSRESWQFGEYLIQRSAKLNPPFSFILQRLYNLEQGVPFKSQESSVLREKFK